MSEPEEQKCDKDMQAAFDKEMARMKALLVDQQVKVDEISQNSEDMLLNLINHFKQFKQKANDEGA